MTCTQVNCDREITNKKRGLCRRCYQYWLMTEAPHKPRCPIENCDRPQWTRGYCNIHYRRAERNLGDPNGVGRGSPGMARGRRNLKGKYVTSGGYVRVRVDLEGLATWPLEHRLVMEQTLGRKLLDGENVHHIDGNKENNEPGNLELWVSPQPTGQRVEDALVWAYEIIRRYEHAETNPLLV